MHIQLGVFGMDDSTQRADPRDIEIAVRQYLHRGWNPIPLHHMTRDPARPAAGPVLCSCGNPHRQPDHDRRQGGKHPIFKDWQHTDYRNWLGWRVHCGAGGNVGIATGAASGFWVLDYDPDAPNASDDAHAIVALLVNTNGMRAQVRTGGGGWHWRFALPADFEVTNSSGRLPGGLDVRGTGGQVVAPPSISGKGRYVELTPEGPYAAPGWLLDLIRPTVRDRPEDSTGVPGSSGGAPSAGSSAAVPAVSDVADTPAIGQDRAYRYSVAALRAICEEHAQLDDGRRGEAAWALACRAVELMNLGRLSGLEVFHHVATAIALARANAPGGLTGSEATRLWQRAVVEVGDRTAELVGDDPTVAPPMPPGEAIPFSSAPQVGADMNSTGSTTKYPDPTIPPLQPESGSSISGYVGSPNGSAGPPYGEMKTDSRLPTSFPGSSLMPMTVEPGQAPPVGAATLTSPTNALAPVPDSPWERAVGVEISKMLVREEARRRVEARSLAGQPPIGGEFVTAASLVAIPAPDPLIPGWLDRGTLARLNGRPGTGKSFVAVDVACAIATGTAWAGRPATRGAVIYVTAEDLPGVARRTRAWCQARQLDVSSIDLQVFPRSVQVGGSEWSAFVAACQARAPALIVADTQARVSVGRQENDASDMGEVVAGLELLRESTGACVLLVHHSSKTGADGRGSNAVEGAMASEFTATMAAGVITVKTTKQKYRAGDATVSFDLRSEQLSREVEPGVVEPDGEPVAVPHWRDLAAVPVEDGVSVGERRQRVLWRVMHRGWSVGEGGSRADIKGAWLAEPELAGLSRTGVYEAWARAWNGLIDLGLICKNDRGDRFRLIVVPNQTENGVLTTNRVDDPVQPPTGYSPWLFDDEVRVPEKKRRNA